MLRSGHRPRRAAERPDTRAQLLEAAGQVFAEEGLGRATGRAICDRAGANTAAINYYFGGMEGLYAAVLEVAHSRLFTLEMVAAAVAGKPDARSRLEALLKLIVGTLLGPVSTSCVLRVLTREIVSPSPAFEALRERELLPKVRILKAIVADLMGLAEDHPSVARGCVSIMGPCIALAIANRSVLRRAFPKAGFAAADTASIVRHMTEFAVAGFAAVADAEARHGREADRSRHHP